MAQAMSETQSFNWLLANFVQETDGVTDAVAVSSDGLLMALSDGLDRKGAERQAAIRSRLQEPTAPTATALGLYGLVADAADERREGLAALRDRWRALAAGDLQGRLRALTG